MFVRETTKTAVTSASCGRDSCTKTLLGETILMVSSDHTHTNDGIGHPRTAVATMWELRFQTRKRKYKDHLGTFFKIKNPAYCLASNGSTSLHTPS